MTDIKKDDRGVNFEELDYQRTALGELILRRRRALALDGREIFEGNSMMNTSCRRCFMQAK